MTRRTAALAALGLLLGVAAAPAQERGVGFYAESGTSVYANDDGLTVVSPWAEARQRVVEPVVVRARWQADVISAATVDVITAATASFEETRHEGALSVDLDLGRVRANAGYTGSIENDTQTHLVALGGELDLYQRNLTLGLGYALGLDRLGRVDEPESLWRDRTTHRVDASATQVLGRDTVGVASYTLQYMTGFLASAYRHVPLFPRTAETLTRASAQWVRERHPDTRARHAATLKVRHALTRWLFAHAEYRGYLDSWSMRANAAELGGAAEVGAGFTLEASNRLSHQSRASFFRPVYTVNRDYITQDRRLSTLTSYISRLAVRWRGGWLEAVLAGEYHWMSYADFRVMDGAEFVPANDPQAVVLQAALAVDF